MENTFLTVVVILFLLLTASTSYAAYLLGTNRALRKFIISFAREKKYLRRELVLWQNKALTRSGTGSLRRDAFERERSSRDDADTSKIIPRVVGATEAIARDRQQKRENPPVARVAVPAKVKDSFITDASRFAHRGQVVAKNTDSKTSVDLIHSE